MKKLKLKLWLFFFILSFILVIHTVIDNQRIAIIEQVVEIPNLPEEVDGFTILQVTDLHEKEFGQNQSRLIKKINSLSYDAIVFTGDMLKRNESTNYQPFYSLLAGLENKEVALFVPGNTDPSIDSEGLYKSTDFYAGMVDRGVRFLQSIDSVERGSSRIYFANFDYFTNSMVSIVEGAEKELSSADYLTQQQFLQEVSAIDNKVASDVLIGLGHFPAIDEKLERLFFDPNQVVSGPDLIIAGHYHGGQIRLPFFGALFIPEGGYAKGGFFPPRDRVKGLWDYKGIQQFVSTGLGSSDAFPLLAFRFFNTPEINLLILKNKS